MNKLNVLISTAVASLLMASAANAATETTTFTVGATVVDSCSISATNLAFGNFDPLLGTALDATSTIDVTCSSGDTYDIGLDAGTATGATVTTRAMTSGVNTLNYALYSDSGRLTNWGNTPATDTVSGTGTGAAQTLTVYGRIPAQASAVIGTYSDTITVTVTY